MATKRSRFEIGHPTVVPTNYRPEDEADAASESARENAES